MHIIDKDGNLLPSAFIPFCAFGTNISTMGVKIDKFDVPICNSFKAKVLNDQLCYEVDVKEVIDQQVLKKELDIGLTERSGKHSYSRPHDSHSGHEQQSAHQAEIK